MQNRTTSQPKIVDVSHYEYPIDWKKVRASGIRGAYLKCTEGVTIIDSEFDAFVKHCKNEGVMIGAYHFAHPENNSAIDEAKHFLNTVKKYNMDFLPVLDIESPQSLNKKINSHYIINWIKEFIHYVEYELQAKVMLYTGQWYIEEFEISGLSKTPLWIALYSSQPPKNVGGWTSWTAWQYSDKEDVPGIGPCDVSAVESLENIKNNGIKPVSTPKSYSNPQKQKVEVTANLLNVRTGPGTKYSIHHQVPKGTILSVEGDSGGWLALGNGLWISSSYVRKV